MGNFGPELSKAKTTYPNQELSWYEPINVDRPLWTQTSKPRTTCLSQELSCVGLSDHFVPLLELCTPHQARPLSKSLVYVSRHSSILFGVFRQGFLTSSGAILRPELISYLQSKPETIESFHNMKICFLLYMHTPSYYGNPLSLTSSRSHSL